MLRTAATAVCIALALGGSARAADGSFDKFLDPNGPKCFPLADLEKMGHSIPLSNDQFQFARAVFALIPPISQTMPVGDRAVIVGAADATAMVGLVDGDKVCGRFMAPPFILQMLNDIKAGKVTHAGDPT